MAGPIGGTGGMASRMGRGVYRNKEGVERQGVWVEGKKIRWIN
jgi:hypothetical protein